MSCVKNVPFYCLSKKCPKVLCLKYVRLKSVCLKYVRLKNVAVPGKTLILVQCLGPIKSIISSLKIL